MDPYHNPYNSQPPLPITASYHPSQPPYPGINPYSVPPYSAISSEFLTMPQQQPMFMTPTQMHPQLVTGVAPYYIEETSLWASFLETCCCCFGYGPPQTPFEAMHRQEMERRRVLAKEEKYRRSQYQKALQQEKQRMSLVQSAKASNEAAAAAAAAAAGVNTNATANTNAAAPIATNTPSANNNAVQQ